MKNKKIILLIACITICMFIFTSCQSSNNQNTTESVDLTVNTETPVEDTDTAEVDEQENKDDIEQNSVVTFGYTSIPDDGILNDDLSDVNAEFVDIKSTEISFEGNNINIKMEMRNIPEIFTINKENNKKGVKEYIWSIYFDINDDKTRAGDIQLQISRHKSEDAEEEVALSEPNFLGDIWHKAESNIKYVQNVKYKVEDNSILVAIDKSSSELLANISEQTPVSITTYYKDGKDIHEDYLPTDR